MEYFSIVNMITYSSFWPSWHGMAGSIALPDCANAQKPPVPCFLNEYLQCVCKNKDNSFGVLYSTVLYWVLCSYGAGCKLFCVPIQHIPFTQKPPVFVSHFVFSLISPATLYFQYHFSHCKWHVFHFHRFHNVNDDDKFRTSVSHFLSGKFGKLS